MVCYQCILKCNVNRLKIKRHFWGSFQLFSAESSPRFVLARLGIIMRSLTDHSCTWERSRSMYLLSFTTVPCICFGISSRFSWQRQVKKTLEFGKIRTIWPKKYSRADRKIRRVYVTLRNVQGEYWHENVWGCLMWVVLVA